MVGFINPKGKRQVKPVRAHLQRAAEQGVQTFKRIMHRRLAAIAHHPCKDAVIALVNRRAVGTEREPLDDLDGQIVLLIRRKDRANLSEILNARHHEAHIDR